MLIELSILLSTIFIILFLFHYYGLFQVIDVKTGECPFNFEGKTIAYQLFKGTKKEIDGYFKRVSLIISCYTNDNNNNNNKIIPFCAFHRLIKLEDGNLTYRSVIGAIFNCECSENADVKIRKEYETIKEYFTNKDFKFGVFPKVDVSVYARYPNRGFISVAIAVRRVYPLLINYVKEYKLCAYPSIEIYFPDEIYFIAPLFKQYDSMVFDESFLFIKDESTQDTEDESQESTTSSFEHLDGESE